MFTQASPQMICHKAQNLISQKISKAALICCSKLKSYLYKTSSYFLYIKPTGLHLAPKFFPKEIEFRKTMFVGCKIAEPLKYQLQ